MSKKPASLDPKNINARLYNQVDAMLLQLEARDDDPELPRLTLKERIAALIAIARIQVAFVGLRKEKLPDDDEPGSAVRKYATAFANDARRGTTRGGRGTAAATARRPAVSNPAPEPDDLDLDLDDDDEAG